MNFFLYYFDKLTAWLDFSWLVGSTPTQRSSPTQGQGLCNSDLPVYSEHEPLLRL